MVVTYRRAGGLFMLLTLAVAALAATVLTVTMAGILLIVAACVAAVALVGRALLPRRSRDATPAAERPTAVFRIEPRLPRVPAEYVSLYTYLEHRYASIVVLTFEQMEALLGFALPAPACTDRDWWTGAAVHTHGHAAAWTGAGRTATPNLSARTVTFERPL